MLGNVVQQQLPPEEPKISTRLTDAILEKWIERRDPGIPPTLIPQEEEWREFWLYASDTKNWCPRLYAMAALFGGGIAQVNDAETCWNFGQGTVYHELFQKKILPCLGDGFQGAWEYVEFPEGRREIVTCPLPSNTGDGRVIARGWCPKPEWVDTPRYIESKVRIPEYRVVVKMDAILKWDDIGYEIFELKTEKDQARDSLNPMLGGGPRPQHIEQVQIAMWATGIKRARIVYLFKGEFSLRNSLVEHEIMYDQSIVDKLKELAKRCVDVVRLCDEIKADNPNNEPLFASTEEAVKWLDEHVPRLEDCPMKSKGKARYCAGRDACFPGRGGKKSE